MGITTILLIAAAILFALSAFGVKSPVHLGWAGACIATVAFIL